MKLISTTLCCLLPLMLLGQTEGRKLLAHYPLIDHFGDVTGQEDTMITSHVEITEEGVYIDGADRRSDTANVIMAEVDGLDLDDFYISLEVKIDSLEGEASDQFIRPVFIGGLGTEWMNVLHNQRLGLLFLAHSGGGGAKNTRYEANRWYQLGLSYDRATMQGLLYLDGEVVIAESFDLAGEDNTVLGLGQSNRSPMKGHWRNLKVFGQMGSGPSPLSVSCHEASPPTSTESEDGTIALAISGGTPPFHLAWSDHDTSIVREGIHLISGLAVGTYSLRVRDGLNVQDSCELQLWAADDPTNGRNLLAHYPLESHLGDITGQEDSLETSHAFLDEEGLYISGADPNSDTANHVTVTIGALDLDDFYISLEVKLDSVPEDGIQAINLRHIFLGGLGWRWMRFIVNQQFDFITLSTRNRESPWVAFEFDQWYTFGMYYDREDREGRFYLDGELQFTLDNLDINDMNDRRLGLGCNCGPWPMKGHWRNLKIYGPDAGVDPLSFSCSENQLPTDENSGNGSMRLQIEGGTGPYLVKWNGGDTIIHTAGDILVANLGIGTYTFHITDSLGIQDSCTSSLVFPVQLPLIAHYPLAVDGRDILGLNDDLKLENVEFVDSSLFINGADSFSDTSNMVTAMQIGQLNFDHFQVDLEFKLDSISGGGVSDRVIWMGGSSRWLTLAYNSITNQMTIASNSSIRIPINFAIAYGQWYAASMIYNRATQELSLWMDGTKVHEDMVDVMGGSDKRIVVDCKCGPRPMKGYWRNLRIYSEIDSTTTSEQLLDEDQDIVSLFPNPGSSHLSIELANPSLSSQPILLFDALGRLVKKFQGGLEKRQTFAIEDLETGIYWIRVGKATAKLIKI